MAKDFLLQMMNMCTLLQAGFSIQLIERCSAGVAAWGSRGIIVVHRRKTQPVHLAASWTMIIIIGQLKGERGETFVMCNIFPSTNNEMVPVAVREEQCCSWLSGLRVFLLGALVYCSSGERWVLYMKFWSPCVATWFEGSVWPSSWVTGCLVDFIIDRRRCYLTEINSERCAQ